MIKRRKRRSLLHRRSILKLIIMDAISILKERGIRRFEGFLTLFNLSSSEGAEELPLYYWENPFILASIKSPEEKLREIDFIIHGIRYNVERARFIGDYEIESLIVELSNEKGQKYVLKWNGKELVIFSTIYPELKRRLEVYTAFLIPFKKAIELLKKGYPIVREKFVFENYESFFLEEAKERLNEKVFEKIIHPVNLRTQDLNILYSGIREMVDPIVLSTRIATYSLDIIAALEKIYERLTGLKLGESQEGIALIEEAAKTFWMKRPQLRGDPILPDKDLFIELLLNIWSEIKDIVDDKERLRVALNVVRSEVDLSDLILKLKGLFEP